MSGDLWAGAEVMAYNLILGLRDFNDIEVYVLALNEGKLVKQLQAAEIEVVVNSERSASFLEIFWRTRKILHKRSPMFVHSHRYKENILASISKARNSKLISTIHGLPEIRYRPRNLPGFLIRKINLLLLSHKFDRVIGVSDNIKRYLKECKIPLNKQEIIKNGIVLPFFKSRPIREITIGSAGRLFAVKDFQLMVEIGRILSKKEASVQFILAGEGPERDRLAGLIELYQMKNLFRLVGNIENMNNFYNNIDIYLNTSFHEGIPMSILEAMAHGLPVVAPRVGGIGEIIESGSDGFLVDGRNPEDFANICFMLMKEREIRNRIGEVARKKIERKFSAKIMAERYYKLYKSIIEN